MSDVKFTSHLMGGLGNQMFQMSHTISQSWKHNTDCVFLKKSETPGNGKQPHNYINNIYKNLKFSDEDKFDLMLRENHFNDAKINIIPNKSIKFWGYFQSSKNFLGYDEKIKSIFEPDLDFIKKIKNKYPQLNGKTTSLHIRRGDYLTITNVLPIIDKTYFDFSLKEIGDVGQIFIFTNDKEWVENNMSYKNSIIVSDLEDYEELWMMSLCNNNILSNSSFSWWAAFLNNNKDKKIMVPSVWFGPRGEHPHFNIFEKEWTKVDVFYENGMLKK
jgi:hypothetical protein